MKTERVILSFIAVGIGLLVAGVAFFIYQSTKSIPASHIPTITINNPTPTPPLGVFLGIDQPLNDSVTDKRSITISGKTTPDATIVLNSQTDDQVVTPATTGAFSITTTLDAGENLVTLTAINKNGEETKQELVITSSGEDF